MPEDTPLDATPEPGSARRTASGAAARVRRYERRLPATTAGRGVRTILLTALALSTGCGGPGSRPAPPRPPIGSPPPPPPPLPFELTPQESGTAALLQAVSAVDARVAWVGGHDGTYLRTTDGGRSWRAADGPGPDSLQFRDAHAVDASTAYLLSAGPGELSRIYKTTDAGRSWTLQFLNREPDAFFDCMDFWDARRGLAFSDAVEGEFVIIVTEDGGETWTRVPPDRVPDARPGEAGFAASGTCVAAGPEGLAWIGTGAADPARVLRTTDYGRSWSISSVPLVAGEAAGIFSVAFRDRRHGVVLGGDLSRPEAHLDSVVARTEDGGRRWVTAGRPWFGGPIYGAAYLPTADSTTLVAVGPNGMAWSPNEGRRWERADTLAYWAVGFAPSGVGWAVGPEGRVVKLTPR